MKPTNRDSGRWTLNVIALIGMMAVCVVPATALDERYSPFSPAETRLVKATLVRNSSKAMVAATVLYTGAGDDGLTLRVTIAGKTVYEEAVESWMTMTKAIVADLDGNGPPDVVKKVYHGSMGLGLGCELLILSQYEPGKFMRILVPSERFTPEDICDFDRDGKKEIVTCVLITHERHSYWVYRCWKLKGTELVNIDAEHQFPRGIWFREKPNRRLIGADLLKKVMEDYPAFSTHGTQSADKLGADEGK